MFLLTDFEAESSGPSFECVGGFGGLLPVSPFRGVSVSQVLRPWRSADQASGSCGFCCSFTENGGALDVAAGLAELRKLLEVRGGGVAWFRRVAGDGAQQHAARGPEADCVMGSPPTAWAASSLPSASTTPTDALSLHLHSQDDSALSSPCLGMSPPLRSGAANPFSRDVHWREAAPHACRDSLRALQELRAAAPQRMSPALTCRGDHSLLRVSPVGLYTGGGCGGGLAASTTTPPTM